MWTYIYIYIKTGTGSFLGIKAAGAWCWQPTLSSAKVKEVVQLYIYSLSWPLWSVLGQILFVCLCVYTYVSLCKTHSSFDVPMDVSPFITKYWLCFISVQINTISSYICQCILKGSGLNTHNFPQIRSYRILINTETVSERMPLNQAGEMYLLNTTYEDCKLPCCD
jgi:hypothetical protein